MIDKNLVDVLMRRYNFGVQRFFLSDIHLLVGRKSMAMPHFKGYSDILDPIFSVHNG